MQSLLRNNRKVLLENGICVVDLWGRFDKYAEFRRLAMRAMWPDDPALEDIEKLKRILVEQFHASENHDENRVIDTYIISFENIIGSYHLSNTMGIYPNAARAVRMISETFPQLPLKAFFSIRSFDRFIESCYLQSVYTQKEHRPFREFYRDVRRTDLSWVDSLKAIVNVVGDENIVVWTYETFRKSEERIWRELLRVPETAQLLLRPASRSNTSMSEKGVEFMRAINQVGPPTAAKKFRRIIKHKFSTGTGDDAPRLLRKSERTKLQDLYAAELRTITQSFDLL